MRQSGCWWLSLPSHCTTPPEGYPKTHFQQICLIGINLCYILGSMVAVAKLLYDQAPNPCKCSAVWSVSVRAGFWQVKEIMFVLEGIQDKAAMVFTWAKLGSGLSLSQTGGKGRWCLDLLVSWRATRSLIPSLVAGSPKTSAAHKVRRRRAWVAFQRTKKSLPWKHSSCDRVVASKQACGYAMSSTTSPHCKADGCGARRQAQYPLTSCWVTEVVNITWVISNCTHSILLG